MAFCYFVSHCYTARGVCATFGEINLAMVKEKNGQLL